MPRRKGEWEDRLPRVPDPVANYVTFRMSGNLAFTSGLVPMVEGKLQARGRLGEAVTVAQGYQAARTCALLALSVLRDKLGSLSKIKQISQMVVYVSSAPGFEDQHKVADGATDLLVEVLGENGKPARTAIGVASLPLGASVEVSLTAEVLA